tara:strand:- start:361 stop:975 length:615 start_codon:yes stop_codon:yes gene_type:complete
MNSLNETTDEPLDTSWLEKYDRILDIQNNYEKEKMNSIQMVCIYINGENEIQHVHSESLMLELCDKGSHINKDDLLTLIQRKKYFQHLKYKLEDILFYHVPLEHEKISDYSKSETDEGDFLQKVSFLDSLDVPDSIFIFHEINTLYFIFVDASSNKHNHTIKSILKKPNREPNPLSKTKKVQINDVPSVLKSKKPKKTRKKVLK